MQTEAKIINSRVLYTKYIQWQSVQWLQNENLKEWKEESITKLKNSLIENSFVMPFHVWEDTNGLIWILDGYHRQKALELLLAEGIEVPKELPATFIQCESG